MKSGSRGMSMLEAVTLGFVATGAVSIAVLTLTGAVGRVVEIFGSSVTVGLPLHDAPIAALSNAGDVTSAEYSDSVVTFSSLDAGTRWLLVGETALPALATVIVCMSLWWLGFSLIRQRAFRRSMAPVLASAAIGLIVAGMIGPLLGGIARAQAVELLPASASEMFWTFLVRFDPSPVGWGIALALVTAAFEVGQRMQKDTEGLV